MTSSDRRADTLATLFEAQCSVFESRLAYAFVRDDLSVVEQSSYGRLAQDCRALAVWLSQRTQPGDRVLLALPAGLDFVRLFWACMLSGRVAVPVPAPDALRLLSAAPRLRGIVQDARAVLVVTSASLLETAARVLDPATFIAARWLAMPELDAIAQQPATSSPNVTPTPESLAYLQYTSGSTSAPRGVRISHANVLANLRALADAGRVEPASRNLSWLPHFHDYGLVGGLLVSFSAGAASWLMSPVSFLRRPLRWLDAVGTFGMTHTAAPESAFVACLHALDGQPYGGDLRTLQMLSCGAEPIRAATVERVLAALGPAGLRATAFAPAYGLAEAVLGVSSASLDQPPRFVTVDAAALRCNRLEWRAPDVAGARRLVGCGAPLSGTEVAIVDPDTCRPCAADAVGEIWVRSPSVGGGYWMQPAASEANFQARLAGEGPVQDSGPFLRTGDLGFLHQSELFITGRLKDLVIVHGENHYPQDLEWTAEHAHADLRVGHGAAFAVDTEDGEGVVLALEMERRASLADAPTIAGAVRRAIGQAHALPVEAVVLVRSGALPRTSSGKIQRQRCRAAWLDGELDALAVSARPSGDEPVGDEALAASPVPPRDGRVMPRDATEQALWEVWREVLDTRAFGVHEGFFELGGHSLMVTQVVSRITERLGVELPLAALFEHDSIAALAQQVAAAKARPALSLPGSALPALVRVARGRPLPVSLSQRRMWVIQQFDPRSTAYNVAVPMHVRGHFDPAVLQRAVDLLVARHEALRTCFRADADGPTQWIEPALRLQVEQIDLSHVPDTERHARARALLAQRLAEPFDLAKAPLHRPTLLRLGEREHVLFWLIHHAITDNWSTAVLVREGLSLYGALVEKRTPSLAPIDIEYADYAIWQRGPAAVAARQPHLDYWVRRLQGLPVLELPTDFPRPVRASFRGARVSAALPPRLLAAVHAFCGGQAVTPFMVFFSAFALLLSRQARTTDIGIGMPIANRNHLATEHLVGTLVNTLVMRADLSSDPTFTELVQRVRATALEAYAHQDAPFDELIDALGHDRSAHPEGLVRVLFNVLNAPVGRLATPGLEIEEFDFDRCAAQFDLSMHIDTEFGRRIHLEYATELYARVSAERLLDNYLALLEALLAQPAWALSAFGMLAPAQLSLLRHGWNPKPSSLPAERVVHRYLDIERPEHRQRIAVIDAQGREIRYGELASRSNALARALRARGIERGQRVGLCIERGPEMLVAQLAVFKAGAAYVPLDPAYPADRLRYMARDAGLSALLLLGAPDGLFDDDGVPQLAMDDAALYADHADGVLAPDLLRDAEPHDEAYVVYTSGSTGQPKGVRVPHGAVVNFLAGMVKMPGLRADDCVLAITSPSFDPSVLDLLLPLAVGACVVIASHPQAHDPVLLRELLERHHITLMQATPSAWRMVMDAGWKGHPAFRALIGGEALPPMLAERLMARCSELWNIYGPTETTVWTTAWRVESPRTAISIGRPIANTTVWPLDEHGQPCQIGAAGELCIGGADVTLGYHGLDELTADRFVPDPWSDSAGARMYRSGDLGRWRYDGTLEHLGRLDHQVKLRGFRIELGEIESALLEQPGVGDCVVVTRAESEDDVRLVAYLVAAGAMPAWPALREQLRARLPHYMIPQHFVTLAALPRLPNGKVDRAALPAPQPEPAAIGAGGFVAPHTPDQRAIAAIWAEVLEVGEIGLIDNFFDLGGHSLLAMRAVALIRQRMGWRIDPPRFIFETLAQLANANNLTDAPHAVGG